MTTDNRVFQFFRDNTKATQFGIDLCDKKFTCAAHLLSFCTNICTRYNIAQYNAFGMELDTAALVLLGILNFNKLFAVFNNFA